MDEKPHTHNQQSRRWWQILGPDFPYQQFALGALIPVSIFYTFQHYGLAIQGALLAAGWGLGVLITRFVRSHKIDLFSGLAVPAVLFELVGTLITRSPDFYLAAPAVTSALWGLFYLVSVFFPRPLIQIFAELLTPGLGTEEFFQKNGISRALYRSSWQVVTTVWGVVNLLTALLLIIAQRWLSLETFIFIRTASGIPLTVALIAFSMRFPAWYIGRALRNGRS